MTTDVSTVAWKELREILSAGGTVRSRRGVIRTIVFPVLLGVFLGVQAGTARSSFTRGISVFPVGLLAMATAAGLVTDAVAGERERHTLETLLASPASDASILAGKMTAVVGYAWVLALTQLVAVGLASAIAGRGVPPLLLLLVAVLALLEAVLAAGFGVQFSFSAPTVRVAARKQAQYSVFINVIASAVNVLAVAPTHGPVRPVAVVTAIVVLVVSDTVLVAMAHTRFRRGRLVLD
jgi:ABC-2 type transport system permease protein